MDCRSKAVIPFTLQDEPASFEADCRTRGRKWLAKNPAYENRPKDYWSKFEPELRSAFREMCGWCAMHIMRGQVDHFVPCATLKKTGRDALAYEWSNFRYIDGWINQKKLHADVLDPFVVQDGWFEITLPSLQLLPTEKIPIEYRELAKYTLTRLGLRDHEVVVRFREGWFSLYRNGELTLDGLRKMAPLIAMAVERDLNKGKDWRIPGEHAR
jgi:hypothetical protein